MAKSNKILVTRNAQGDILDVASTADVEILTITDTEQGGITADVYKATKLDRASFREQAWDALAVGLDSSAAEEHDVNLKVSTIKFLHHL